MLGLLELAAREFPYLPNAKSDTCQVRMQYVLHITVMFLLFTITHKKITEPNFIILELFLVIPAL